MCDWLNKFHDFSLLYMTLVVDKMDGHGHINTVRCERLPKKTKVTGTSYKRTKTEHFIYKSEWANA